MHISCEIISSDSLQTGFFKSSKDNTKFEFESSVLVDYISVEVNALKCMHFTSESEHFMAFAVSDSGLLSSKIVHTKDQ